MYPGRLRWAPLRRARNAHAEQLPRPLRKRLRSYVPGSDPVTKLAEMEPALVTSTDVTVSEHDLGTGSTDF